MNTDCLDYCLTEKERLEFERDGFFVVEDALPPQTVEDITAAVDRLNTKYRAEQALGPRIQNGKLNLHDVTGKDDLFLQLVDWPTTFAKVWGIMGWNIQVYHTQMIVTPPLAPADQELGRKKRLVWHKDNNRMNQDLALDLHPETSLPPRMSLKVAYFLTDMMELGRANFYVVPGSHVLNELKVPEKDGLHPKGAMGVQVKAGSAVIFDRRLWHASSPNVSNVTRKALFYGYSFRWLRPKCEMAVSHIIDACDPIRKQLLGVSTNAGGYFRPKDEDVPLRDWLGEHVGV
jgi:ectoine hydroxylase-related dioxygenase (phytanoyl-CoA dioxygenase family)